MCIFFFFSVLGTTESSLAKKNLLVNQKLITSDILLFYYGDSPVLIIFCSETVKVQVKKSKVLLGELSLLKGSLVVNTEKII